MTLFNFAKKVGLKRQYLNKLENLLGIPARKDLSFSDAASVRPLTPAQVGFGFSLLRLSDFQKARIDNPLQKAQCMRQGIVNLTSGDFDRSPSLTREAYRFTLVAARSF